MGRFFIRSKSEIRLKLYKTTSLAPFFKSTKYYAVEEDTIEIHAIFTQKSKAFILEPCNVLDSKPSSYLNMIYRREI